MKRPYILLFTILSILLCCGCGDKSRLLAKVDGKAITVGDFEKRLSKMPAYYKTLADRRKRDFLEDMIAEELLYNEAIKRRLNRDTEVKELINEAERKILIAKLIEVEAKKTLKITDEEIMGFYEEHKDDFVIPVKLRASHILVDTQEEAQQILQELNSGADFTEMAKKYSKDSSRDKGGDIGYFTRGQLMPEIEEVCFNMEVGQAGGPVKTQFGYHVIMLTDKKESRAVELSEVRDGIDKQLRNRSQQEMLDNLVKDLKSKARIKINDRLLEADIR